MAPSENTGSNFDPQRSLNELGDLLQGIGRTIEESISRLGTRGNVITVRVNDRALEAIDALIAAGIFKTRSEAAAYLIDEGISAKAAVFEEVNATARRINELRDQMKDLLRQGIRRPATNAGAAGGSQAGPPPTATSALERGGSWPAGER
ncbi:MAG: ribbon-helix-helix domain-containing protein [Chloroflexi bacterium]|jgi:Arc/MetJ-type ribon-helix-helix transcriptional regulator|nr:ribbon-helix-helix domain-containing protein [Chloroflexota bacterium]